MVPRLGWTCQSELPRLRLIKVEPLWLVLPFVGNAEAVGFPTGVVELSF